MTSYFAEKYALLKSKQQENQSLREEVSRNFALLLQAFWQKFSPLEQVEKLTFTPQELKAWLENRAAERRRE